MTKKDITTRPDLEKVVDVFYFGFAGDVPITGDFDGDTRTDFGVFRPSSSTWYVLRSDGITITDQFGTPGDIPVPADYDGDGVSDLAIYRPSVGQWWVNRSIAGVVAETFGTVNDKPVPADYTGDGQVDIAVWRDRPASGLFSARMI